MKRILSTVAALAFLAAAIKAAAGVPAGTGINGSVHDMTRYTANADLMGRVCVFCHTPHNATLNTAALTDQPYLPLWNHIISSVQFTPYRWSTPDTLINGQEITDPLAGQSRLCMSCHDGSIAVDQHGGAMGSMGSNGMGGIRQSYDGAGRALFSADLSGTHPIGFDYNQVAVGRNARTQRTGLDTNARPGTRGVRTGRDTYDILVDSHQGYAVAIDSDSNGIQQGEYNRVRRNTSGDTIADHLYNGNIMTCVTCHEVHNKQNALQADFSDGTMRTVLGTQQSAPNYLLRAPLQGSLICLSCHIK